MWMFVFVWIHARGFVYYNIYFEVLYMQMQFVHVFMRVLVFVLHPTSCPGLRLSSSTTW